MNNLDRISAALSEWAFNVAKSALPQVQISANSTLGHIMGLIGADVTKYNVWNELGFLAEPMLQTLITPAVRNMLGNFPDEQLPELAEKYVAAFIEQAQKKGSVNVFGLELGANAFEGLRDILRAKMEG